VQVTVTASARRSWGRAERKRVTRIARFQDFTIRRLIVVPMSSRDVPELAIFVPRA
jgi:hypothetical protein